MTRTQITRARAYELVRELINTREIKRQKAQDWVQDLVKMSHDRSGTFISTLRGEVRKPLKRLGFTNVDDLATRVGNALALSSTVRHEAPALIAAAQDAATRTATAKKVPAQKAAACKAPAKKVPAQDFAARKASATKAPAQKAAVRKAPANKMEPTTGS
jgi:polyhydroxyalkanoate synthesis regulator phasin